MRLEVKVCGWSWSYSSCIMYHDICAKGWLCAWKWKISVLRFGWYFVALDWLLSISNGYRSVTNAPFLNVVWYTTHNLKPICYYIPINNVRLFWMDAGSCLWDCGLFTCSRTTFRIIFTPTVIFEGQNFAIQFFWSIISWILWCNNCFLFVWQSCYNLFVLYKSEHI